jgi:hypothetical protein
MYCASRDLKIEWLKEWRLAQEDWKVTEKRVPLVMEEVTDPAELARARAQRERFDRNAAWLQAHAAEVYARYRGKCICIAGQELFVADTPEEAIAQAKAAHPKDDGSFVHYIPREKAARIYADRWRVAPLR